METNDKNRTTTIAVVTGVIALLFGLCLGALVGGAGGFLLGRQTGARFSSQYLPEAPAVPPVQVMPRSQATPMVPALPVLPNLLNRSGALVREVVAGSPAEAAGLRVGDVITAVDNTPVDTNHPLVDVLGQYQPGDKVTLEVQRGARTRSLNVTLGGHPDDKTRPYLGIRYIELPVDQMLPNPGD